MEKKVESQVIYNGKIITVYKDKVECPNKKIATREIVRHHGGVGILIVVDDCIVLVKQFRYAYNKDTLEIPAGKLEKGEEVSLAGKRELEEETGYSCKDMRLINEIYPTTGYCDEIIDGRIYRVGKGDAIHLPSNVPHGAFIRDVDCKAIDIFVPSRKDYIAKFQNQNPGVEVTFIK